MKSQWQKNKNVYINQKNKKKRLETQTDPERRQVHNFDMVSFFYLIYINCREVQCLNGSVMSQFGKG